MFIKILALFTFAIVVFTFGLPKAGIEIDAISGLVIFTPLALIYYPLLRLRYSEGSVRTAGLLILVIITLVTGFFLLITSALTCLDMCTGSTLIEGTILAFYLPTLALIISSLVTPHLKIR